MSSPRSPRVAQHTTTLAPACAALAITEPVPNVSSSGCATTTRRVGVMARDRTRRASWTAMPYDMPPPSRTLRTTAGRRVSYCEFGDPEGIPVFAMHGTPASGAGFVWADEPAREHGVRLLAPDRPGV